jgi:hypothetical protein
VYLRAAGMEPATAMTSHKSFVKRFYLMRVFAKLFSLRDDETTK